MRWLDTISSGVRQLQSAPSGLPIFLNYLSCNEKEPKVKPSFFQPKRYQPAPVAATEKIQRFAKISDSDNSVILLILCKKIFNKIKLN